SRSACRHATMEISTAATRVAVTTPERRAGCEGIPERCRRSAGRHPSREMSKENPQERTVNAALEYAVNILATLRQSYLVLDKDLRVVSANRAFYSGFQVD